jgi:RNA polymerase-interacting CarD/CdnL/TRCF family regulator
MLVTRLKQNPEDAEKIAARQILELAESIQDVVYYDRDHDVPTETKKALNSAYRVLRQYVDYFYGEGEHLCYEPPTGRFSKGPKQ